MDKACTNFILDKTNPEEILEFDSDEWIDKIWKTGTRQSIAIKKNAKGVIHSVMHDLVGNSGVDFV